MSYPCPVFGSVHAICAEEDAEDPEVQAQQLQGRHSRLSPLKKKMLQRRLLQLLLQQKMQVTTTSIIRCWVMVLVIILMANGLKREKIQFHLLCF